MHTVFINLACGNKVRCNISAAENWQKVNAEPVCFGGQDNTYGAFNITKTGRVKTMKLVHRSGSIRCNTIYGESYWACDNPPVYADKLMTIITNTNKDALLPPTEDLETNPGNGKKHFYSLKGTGHKSAELVFRSLSSPLSLSRNQELQIWYGQDWVDVSEGNNSGETCVDVFAWYL